MVVNKDAIKARMQHQQQLTERNVETLGAADVLKDENAKLKQQLAEAQEKLAVFEPDSEPKKQVHPSIRLDLIEKMTQAGIYAGGKDSHFSQWLNEIIEEKYENGQMAEAGKKYQEAKEAK